MHPVVRAADAVLDVIIVVQQLIVLILAQINVVIYVAPVAVTPAVIIALLLVV